ncbi:hypothetical protein MKZ38_005405 [Zalerion maritima]|uniref:Heterokaryon incompatibility domain-containing protein n=1 Tax=Zalerion maritima TaxID=339359 RepID=A0AAD5WPB1_9PEZI|nr:hypothetical protein MKZ38_005405 [Zalerion maritima]
MADPAHDRDTYSHIPLQGPRHIRTIALAPAQDVQDPIRCLLVQANLDDDPPYQALSYTWGVEPRSRPVDCDGKILLVTPNCEAAMRDLRGKHGDVRILWIDAICIDQSPDAVEERNSQVAMMGQVYMKASQVAIWIGELDDAASLALNTLTLLRLTVDFRSLEETVGAINKLTPKEVEVLAAFFGRPWFSRMWTVQECTLPLLAGMHKVDVAVYCGTKRLRFLKIMDIANALTLRDDTAPWAQRGAGLQLTLTQRFVERVRQGGFRAHIMAGYQSARNWDEDEGKPWLYEILKLSRLKDSLEPRDKIFALYGVFKELGADPEPPDYRRSVEDVYTEAMEMVLRYDASLYALHLVPSLERREGLPSWVPDWGDTKAWSIDNWKGHELPVRPSRASGTSVAEWKIDREGKRLVLSGLVVDTVLAVGPTLQPRNEKIQSDNTKAADIWEIYASCLVVRQWINMFPDREAKYLSPGEEETIDTVFRKTFQDDREDRNMENNHHPPDVKWKQWSEVMNILENQLNESSFLNAQQQPKEDEAVRYHGELEGTLLEEISRDANIQAALLVSTALFSGEMRFGAGVFHLDVWETCQNRTFFATENGYMGTAPGGLPMDMKVGDKLVLVAGIDKPLILRQTQAAAEGLYRLITPASYVHGMMKGLLWPENDAGLDKIVLV